MRRYDSYKESTIHWVGSIPENWGESRVKQYFIERNEKVSDIDYPPLSVTKNGILPQLDNVAKSDNHNDRKRVCHNDFVINSRSDRKGSSGLSKLEGSVSLINIVLIPKNFFPKFSEYLFKSKNFVEEFFRNGKGIHWDLWSTRYSELQNIKIPIPPLSEQQQIASYLDKKTSLIDSLIEKTQRKIELLKEKRTSIINEVVTKGLNPNVDMKDSGVEWIGEIPIDWELRKGSTIGNYSKGKGIKKDEVKETGLPCIRYGEIYTKYNHKFESVETFIDGGVTDIKVKKGTLFLTGSGELLEDIGKCVVYVGNGEIYVGGDIIILKPFNEFDSEFLSYQINSECIRIQREQNGRGGIIVHIYSKNFKDMWFPTPPTSEQQQIVEYLDEQTNLIDNTISIEEKRIELLKEYRQSLISEVVTGKRKVVE